MTPHLVGLARRLEGKPFHLIASHCQNGTKSDVVGYIKSKGVAPDTPNLTVTSAGRHPGVKGNGYVPYYMVFDHTGKLAYHHMCGDYHGGDGLRMIEWVDDLLAKTPAIYLGEEPFEKESSLAQQVAKKRNLKGALVKIDKGLAAEDLDEVTLAELERLKAAVEDYRNRMMSSAENLVATRPSKTIPSLKELARELKGSKLGEPVQAMVIELSKSRELKDAIAIEKKLAKIRRSLEKRPPCKSCKRDGHDGLNTDCAVCREEQSASVSKAIRKLDSLIEGKSSLPIARTVQLYAESLR